MPWREVDTMTLRQEFTALAGHGQVPLAELCRRYGVSRKTGYKWLARVRAAGAQGLQERSRRPHGSPKRTAAAVEAQVVALRQAHPVWGPRKLRRLLPSEVAPAVSTVGAILKRQGLIEAAAAQHRAMVRFEHAQPNDLWQMDFKGHFAIDSGRCHSLTVLDDHSRFSLVLAACADQSTATVQRHLTEAFRRYGLPWRMTMDNGSPWGNDARHPFTPLTVWLMRLDIGVSHSRPYHPQTQGKDERFHRTLKAEVLAGRHFTDLAHVQQHYDAWRHVYNAVRPHQGLQLQVPQQRYRPSARSFPEQLPPLEYGPDDQVRKVQDGGQLRFRGRDFWVPKALHGQPVALRATGSDGTLEVYFGRHCIAEIDLRTPSGTQSNV